MMENVGAVKSDALPGITDTYVETLKIK